MKQYIFNRNPFKAVKSKGLFMLVAVLIGSNAIASNNSQSSDKHKDSPDLSLMIPSAESILNIKTKLLSEGLIERLDSPILMNVSGFFIKVNNKELTRKESEGYIDILGSAGIKTSGNTNIDVNISGTSLSINFP